MLNPKSLLWFCGAGVALSLLGVGAYLLFERRAQPAVELAGSDILARSPGEKPDFAKLENLQWSQIAATAEGSCAEPARTQQVLAVTETAKNSPAVFLRGLLLLGQGDQHGAMAAFRSISVESIPAAYLYAPYRLQSELHPAEPNSFRAPLFRAAMQGQLPPLIQARVMAREANPGFALRGYLGSDPAAWTTYDLELFPFLLQHAGVDGETRAMLRAALRGGRVKQALRGGLEMIATAPTDSAAAFKSNLGKLLQVDTDSQALAGSVAIRQLEIRRQFLAKKYAHLLREHSASEAAGQPDETVLLLTLSAARQSDSLALDRWSQEIKRRHPQPEVEQWIKSLRLASK